MENTGSQTDGPGIIRAFIAIEINESIRVGLIETQEQLKKADARVSWVQPQNIHCTLVFLGDIFADMLDPVAAALNRAGIGFKPFEIEVAGLGFFGSSRFPRVIWAGMTDAAGPLIKLQNDIAMAVSAAGLKPDRQEFKPHLTIGRVRSGRNAPELVKMIEKYADKSFGVFSVRQIVLMKSQLASGGPVYSLLHSAVLAG